jgi:hypothetical protein
MMLGGSLVCLFCEEALLTALFSRHTLEEQEQPNYCSLKETCFSTLAELSCTRSVFLLDEFACVWSAKIEQSGELFFSPLLVLRALCCTTWATLPVPQCKNFVFHFALWSFLLEKWDIGNTKVLPVFQLLGISQMSWEHVQRYILFMSCAP